MADEETPPEETPKRSFYLKGSLYNFMKNTAQLYLPAAGTAYLGLSQVWHFGYGPEVSASVIIVDTFLGVILKVSQVNYNASDERYQGSVDYEPGEHGLRPQITLNQHPEDWSQKEEVSFKVNKPS